MTNDVQINVHWNDDDVPRGMARTRSSVSAFSDDVGRDMDTKLKAEGEKAGQDLGSSVKKKAAESSKQTGSLMGAAIGLGLGISAPVIAGAMIGGVALGAIGMVVAAQKGNAKVVASFTGLKNQVVTEMKSATDQAVPYLVASGHQLQQTFANLGPQMAQAFSYAGPDIQILTAGVDRFATNAMPGMVSAMRGSTPVIQGIATLMAGLGTTTTTVLTAVSAHSQQFGHDIGQLSGLVQNLGGVVGGVLPGLASGFGASVGAVNTLLTAVKPIAPALGSIVGYAAPVYGMFNLFGVAARPVQALGSGLDKVGQSIGKAGYDKFGGTLSTIGKAATGLGSVMPMVGAAVGLVSDVIAASDQKFQAWQGALLQSTATAGQAMQQYSQQAGFLPGQFDRLLQGMTPVQRAQATYNAELSSGKASTGDLSQALGDLTAATEKESAQQNSMNVSLAYGNNLMAAQATAGLAAAGGALAIQSAQLSAAQAQTAYNDSVKRYGANSQQAQQAGNALAQSYISVAQAAGTYAKQQDEMAIASGKAISTEQEKIDVGNAERASINSQIEAAAKAGHVVPAALLAIAHQMHDTGVSAAVATGQVEGVTNKLRAVPPGKKVTVDALTATAVADLRSLGYKVANLRNGRFTVSANTAPAINSIQSVINKYNGRRVNIVVTTSGDVRALGTGKVSARAAGGPVAHGASGMNSSGDWSVMNEYGGEAVRLPSGSTVVPAGSTAEAVRQATGTTTSGGAVEMRFSGDVDTVVASMLTKLIRAGRVQLIDGNGKRVKVGS